MATKVREAMTPRVQAATPEQTVAEAAAMMKENDVGSLPVVADGMLVGLITDRDIVVRAVAVRADPATLKVTEISSGQVLTAEPDQDLDDALRLMGEHQVRRLPVVEHGRLVGMLAQADVAIVGGDKPTGKMLEDISQPSSTARA